MMEGLNHDLKGRKECEEALAKCNIGMSREWKQRKLGKKRVSMGNARFAKTDEDTDRQTKILASLVPDEIIENVDDYSIRKYDATFFFGDVSGFTDLCEKYNRTGKGGPSRLTQVLNSYIGAMVQEILSHNGDVLKFSGDAFLAMWKSGDNDTMPDVVHEALDCALIIQKSYGTYLTDVGVTLKVKLAISAGQALFSLIGDEKMSHYVVVGQPIWDVKTAEYQTSAGEIVVSPSAWQYVNPNEYLAESMRDGKHMKVHGMGPNWKNTQRGQIRYQKDVMKSEDLDTNETDTDDMFTYTDNEDNFVIRKAILLKDDSEGQTSQDEFSLRPTVNDAGKKQIKEKLRRFIIAPVMRGIDLDEPLEYLTEMRQVVILFINVVTEDQRGSEEFVRLVDNSYKMTYNYENDICFAPICGLFLLKFCGKKVGETLRKKIKPSLVDENQGCVNKVSLFDKDLMMLCIFGLRGFKNTLESQTGLRCASEVRKNLKKMPNVQTASIGVTTGMTYCGVVGHPLRREYTVISLTVNKGARIMVAYPDKVTCDRDTFLHSKLEARNFILQEPKELKGITNAGPIYEFRELTTHEGMLNTVSIFPLLGRVDECRTYIETVVKCVDMFLKYRSPLAGPKSGYENMIVIKGDARLGKTRLIDEFIYETPSEIPVHQIKLSLKDSKISYYAIQEVMNVPLELVNKNIEARQSMILQRIGIPSAVSTLCVLNEILNVNFERTQEFLNMPDRSRKQCAKAFLENLIMKCFSTLWVITIDDAEFVDEESWKYIKLLRASNRVLIIITLGSGKSITKKAERHLVYNRKIEINLGPIPKWFHAALACQVLEVLGIPPELEKLIQTRSNGNPGWVESYLISLSQAGGLLIRNIPKEDVLEMGLVTPPVTLVYRSHNVKKWFEQSSISSQSSVSSCRDDGWKMYQYSYKDSASSVDELLMNSEKDSIRGHTIPICTLAPNCNFGDVDSEVTMDVIILKTFDSLTSYEQLLLKCSSVLGEVFLRHMLEYVMNATAPRETALAVMKLFEIRVLTCAHGDFAFGERFMLYRQRLVDPRVDVGIKCDCVGITIDPSCTDLPNYASCGLLRFKLSMFRETTYNLLTDNQKKEFHNRAIRYLEKETRRCNDCGNGFFSHIMGMRNEEGLHTHSLQEDNLSEMGDSDESNLSSLHSAKMTPSILSQMVQMEDFYSKSYKMRKDKYQHTTLFDLNIFNKKHNRDLVRQITRPTRPTESTFSLTHMVQTYSRVDFSNCQCSLILNNMYIQMLEHCRGAGKLNMLLQNLLEYAYLCINDCNIPLAMKLLNEANTIVDTKPKEEDEDSSWHIPVTRGKIHTLIGYARLELGQMEGAFKALYSALKYFGYLFPSTSFGVKIAIKRQEFRQNRILHFCPSLYIRSTYGENAEFCDNISRCLSYLCDLFKVLQIWDMAELAALWSLNEALISDSDFNVLCKAYTDVLEVSLRVGKLYRCERLETLGLQLCLRRNLKLELKDLVSISSLYTAILASRLQRGEIKGVLRLGSVIMHLCLSVQTFTLSLKVLPMLCQVLNLSLEIADAVAMLNELSFVADDDPDYSARTWYYALSVQFILNTGYAVIPFHRCEQYYRENGDYVVSLRDPEAQKRYFMCMWVWCIRNELWETATIWYGKINNIPNLLGTGYDSFQSMFTALRLVEGLIVYLVVKIEIHNAALVSTLYADIKMLLKQLQANTKIAQLIIPRYLHMMSYFRFVTRRDNRAYKLLQKAKIQASKNLDYYEHGWISHNEKAWENDLQPYERNLWTENTSKNSTNWQEILTRGVIYYTLPIPKKPIYSRFAYF